MKVYVASSWKNASQQGVVAALRADGHEVYDFKNPEPGNKGFGWRQCVPEKPPWSAAKTREVLSHPMAEHGFGLDIGAMRWADAIVMVQPCGRSASWELGWGCGAGKLTAVLLVDGQEPELMFKGVDRICITLDELRAFLQSTPAPERDLRAEVARLTTERDRAVAKGQRLARFLANEVTTQDAVELLSAVLVVDAATAPNCAEWRGSYGEREFSVSVQWADGKSPHALIDEARRERDAAVAIIEGRTVAPTDHELEVHAARGGRWRTRYQVGDPALCRDGMEATEAREVRDRMRPLHAYTWWATEADGTPCAWPVVEVSRGR